tara:strand:- start:1192 stop:1410 length:219 start_codon:yes stop_codon:yes gene_type:complete
MNKKDWKYIGHAMWVYAENNDWRNQRVARLLKQLIKEVNENKEMIEDDMGEYEQTNGSNRPVDNDSTGNKDY